MLDGITIEIILLILIGFIMFVSIIVGLIQGFRKNTYYFCATIVFWIIFWITAPLVTGNLIFANEWLFTNVVSLVPIDVGESKTLIDYLVSVLATSLEIDPALASDPAISNTLIAIIQSIAKLIYLPILAFNFFFFKIIIYHAVFKRYLKGNKRILKRLNKKNEKHIQKHNEPDKDLEKRIKRVERQVKHRRLNRAGGLLSGATRGLLTSFLILCVVNSTVKLLPSLKQDDNISASTEQNNTNKTPTIYDFILSQTGNSEVVKTALDMIAQYQSSHLINTTGIKIGSKSADELFIDSILSGKSKDYSFELRNELSTIIQIAEKAYSLTNGFDVESVEWTKLSDQQVSELNSIIVLLSDTDLLNNLASVLVGAALSMEAVAPYMPEDLNVEEYQNINWSDELKTIAQLVSEVYSLGPDIAKLNYFDLDSEIVQNIVLTLSSLQSINFLGHVGISYAVKSLTQDDPAYAQAIRQIENDLAEMALNGSYGQDIASFSDLYKNFIDIYKNTDFSKYQDEEGNITNLVAVLTSVDTTNYQNLVSTILQTNFVTELLPNVLTIVKDKFLNQNAPEIASMINPSVVTSSQWEKEINSLLQIIGDITKDENGIIHPFESIEKYDFTLLSGFSTKTIVESELLSYAMIKIFIDTSNGTGILKEGAESIASFISIPDYLKQDADVNYRFDEKWYGDSSINYSNGELFIMLDTIKNCISQLENLDYPVGSFPAILSQIRPEKLFESDVLYYTVNKLIDSNRQFITVPLSETIMSDHTIDGMFSSTFVSKEELSKIINIFNDRNIIDLESLFVYFDLVENEDGTISQVLIDKEDKTENSVALLDISTNKIIGLLTSDKLYNPNDINDNGENIDKLFSSKILRATLSNLVDSFLGEMIAIPQNSVESDNNCLVYEQNDELENEHSGMVVEKEIKIIRQDQFKSLFMAVKDLEIDLTMFLEQDVDPANIINAFKNDDGSLKDSAKPIFGSQGYSSSKYSGILHGTLSKYIIEFSTIKDENGVLVVPLESIDKYDENLICADEMINLLNSVVILGSDILSAEMNDEQIDVIISKVIDNNEVLDSNIIKATLTKIVSDTDSINIPDATLDSNFTSQKVIAKTHIVDLLNSVESLKVSSNSSNYMDMLNIENLTIGAIKNANNDNLISKSLIIRSILTDTIQTSLEVSIPLEATEEQILTINETNALINTICTVLPENSSFTNISIEGIDMSTLINAKEDIKSSLVIKSLLTKTLKEQTDGVIIVPDSALDNEIISNSEIDNLMSGLDILMKDSDSFTNINIDSIKLKDLKDAKDNIYNSKILNATIANQIINLSNDGTLIVPSQALENGNELTKDEIDNLIVGMNTMLGEDSSINNIDINNIKISNLSAARNNIANSKILNATVTNKLKSQTDVIVVPEVAYKIQTSRNLSDNNQQLLKEDEVINILLGLEKLLGSDTTITSINPDNITTTSLQNAKLEISNSFVLNATIKNKLDDIDAIVIPDGCNNVQTDLALDETQMNYLIEGLVKLLGLDKSIISIDVSTIELSNLSSSTTQINNSLILRATITNQIATQDMLKVPSTAYETNQMFTEVELENIINGIVKLLGSNTTITTINPDNITTTSLQNAKLEISNSVVLNATITDKIMSQGSVVVPNESLIEKVLASDPSQIESTQMNNLVEGLVKLLGLDKSIISIDVSTIELSNLSSSTTQINNSLILRATITNQIATQDMLKVPSTAYETNQMFTEVELENIINGIVKLLGSNTTITTINPDNITTTSLQNAKLEISNSVVLNATITDKIMSQGSVVVPNESLIEKVLASDPSQIESTQMNNLIEGLVKLLGLDKSITSIDVSTIKISNLDSSKQEIASSLILNATVKSQLINVDSIVIPEDTTHDNCLQALAEDELVSLITGLVQILGNDDSISTINVENLTIGKLNNAYKQGYISSSSILVSTITKQINNLKNTNVLLVPLKSYENEDMVRLTVQELGSLLDGLNVLLGDSNISSVDVSTLTIYSLAQSSNALKSSLILNATITNKISSQVSIPVEAYKDSSHTLLSDLEIDSFMNSLVSMFGNDAKINNLPIDSITIKSINDNIDTITSSYILRQTITDKIKLQNTILVPRIAYETTMITDSEIVSMFNVLALLVDENSSITNISGFTSCDISNFTNNIEDISSSLILRTTISKELLNISMLRVPQIAMDANISDYNVIETNEFRNLFIALNDIYSGDISNETIDLSSTKIDNSKATEIANSIIMRTTITQNVKLTIGGVQKPIYVISDNIEKYVSYDNSSLIYNVMTSEELVKVIASINVLLGDNSGFSITLDLTTLINVSENIDVLLASDIMNIAVSDYLLDNYAMYCYSCEKQTLEVVIELPSGNSLENKEILTANSIITVVNVLKSFTI